MLKVRLFAALSASSVGLHGGAHHFSTTLPSGEDDEWKRSGDGERRMERQTDPRLRTIAIHSAETLCATLTRIQTSLNAKKQAERERIENHEYKFKGIIFT